MTNTGTRDQLVAYLVNNTDSAPGPQVNLYGYSGSWSVCITDSRRDEHGRKHYSLWLASTREPTEIRNFKTLDTAHRAAVEIARLADPTNDQAITVRVTTTQ